MIEELNKQALMAANNAYYEWAKTNHYKALSPEDGVPVIIAAYLNSMKQTQIQVTKSDENVSKENLSNKIDCLSETPASEKQSDTLSALFKKYMLDEHGDDGENIREYSYSCMEEIFSYAFSILKKTGETSKTLTEEAKTFSQKIKDSGYEIQGSYKNKAIEFATEIVRLHNCSSEISAISNPTEAGKKTTEILHDNSDPCPNLRELKRELSAVEQDNSYAHGHQEG